MQLIDNNNWNPKETCQEEHCSSKCTHMEYLRINNMVLVFCLCEKHAEQWNQNYFERKKLIKEFSEKSCLRIMERLNGNL